MMESHSYKISHSPGLICFNLSHHAVDTSSLYIHSPFIISHECFFLLLVVFYMGNSFDVFALFSHPCKFMRWKKHQKMKDWAKYLFEGDWATCLSFFVCLRHTHKMYAIWASEDCLILWDDGYNEVLWSVTSHGPFLISLRGNSTNWQTCCCKVFTVIQHSAPTQRQKEYIVSLQHILKKKLNFQSRLMDLKGVYDNHSFRVRFQWKTYSKVWNVNNGENSFLVSQKPKLCHYTHSP